MVMVRPAPASRGSTTSPRGTTVPGCRLRGMDGSQKAEAEILQPACTEREPDPRFDADPQTGTSAPTPLSASKTTSDTRSDERARLVF